MLLPYMRFLFVGPEFCLWLPSDSTSRWTPLPLANTSYCHPCSGLSPPSYRPCWAHKKPPPCQQGHNSLFKAGLRRFSFPSGFVIFLWFYKGKGWASISRHFAYMGIRLFVLLFQQFRLYFWDFPEIKRVKMRVPFSHVLCLMPCYRLYFLDCQSRFLQFRVAEMPPRMDVKPTFLYLFIGYPDIVKRLF